MNGAGNASWYDLGLTHAWLGCGPAAAPVVLLDGCCAHQSPAAVAATPSRPQPVSVELCDWFHLIEAQQVVHE